MNKIFENAYFGKPYKTRDGRKVLYHSYNNIYPDNPYQSHHNLILEKKDGIRDTVWIWCNDYGHVEEHVEGEWLYETNSDIVSEWKEPINDDELDKMAEAYAEEFELPADVKYACKKDFKAGFKVCYRRAKGN